MPDIRPAAASLLEEIAQFQTVTAGKLGIQLTDAPPDIVGKVRDHVDRIREQGLELDEDELAGLAVVLGEQYVRQFGWHWGEVNYRDDGQEEHYVASVLTADNSLAIAPVWWLSDILDGETSNGILLNFNLVAANKIPVADPDSALILH